MTGTEFVEWRFLQTAPAPGSWNMSVDEAVLESIGKGESLPTLRLYTWEPPCLSLGYAQKMADVDRNALARRGWDLVRRPTGGRAILHTDELTYSVIGPLREPRLYGSVLESYNRLARALVRALHDLQLQVVAQDHYPLAPGSSPAGPVCFDVPSNYEITIGGKKLIGSAQARRREGILQHGSLPLCGDLKRITEVLVFPDETIRQQSAESLLSHATTVEHALGRILPFDIVAAAFKRAFQDALNIHFTDIDLTPQELHRVDELVTEKYAHPDWTSRF